MIDNEKEFEDFVRQIKFDDTPDPNHRDKLEQDLLDALTKQPRRKETPLIIWRTIMKSSITKFATAAAVILIGIFSIALLDKSVTPAWAIEDTIKALEHIYSIKISGIVTNDSGEIKVNFILWAKPNEDSTETGELRFEIPGRQVTVVVPSGKTYTYKPKENVVSITEYKNFSINPWLGSKFFNSVKKLAENWQISYGKDEETGKESIFATFLHPTESQSWWFQFDSDTKLPVRFKQWLNTNFEGKPQFYAASIEYNPELPDGIFEFEIPTGAKVVKVPQKLPGYFDDPNVGIPAEGLTDEEACVKIIKDYWQAIIDGDWEYLAQLRPVCNAKKWELRYKYNESWPVEVLEISQPSQKDDCNIGPVVPCRVKYSDGQIKNVQMVVKLRNIDGNKSCVIAGTYGKTKDFER
jgi:outer membrane lipoprotein-sorting protein